MADIPLDPRLQSQLLDLYRLSGDRLASTQPVHDAAMAMATRLAPGYARAAMRPTPTPSAPLTTGSTSGGPGAGGVAAAAIASLLANAGRNGASGDIGKLIQQLVKLIRGHGRDTVQGNQPFPGGALTGGGQPPQYPFPGFAPNDGSERGGNPNVSTDVNVSFPNDILNDPTLLNSFPVYPTDPSGDTGVGPGMQGYRSGGGGNLFGVDPNEE